MCLCPMYARYVVPLSLDAAAAASSCRGELAPCIAGPEPVLRALSHFDGLVMRKLNSTCAGIFKTPSGAFQHAAVTKLVINTTRPPPITRASTCIIALDGGVAVSTRCSLQHDAEPVQYSYNAQILLLGGLTSHPDPQASRVEGGERWKLERSLPGVRFSTARASVPFRFRALAARISPVAVRRKCRRGASPETPPDFYGDATRIGVASRVGSSIVNDQWRWGRTIGVHSASVPATAPRSASARSLAATSSFA